MFKDRKIEKFIDKYSDDFANIDHSELQEFLSRVYNINGLISRINKLPEREVHYLLSTISDYKYYNLNEYSIDLLLCHKLDMIKKFGTYEKCPELDKIYYGLSPDESLYKMFVMDYMRYHEKNQDSRERVSLEKYSLVLSRNYKKIKGLLGAKDSFHSFILVKKIMYLKPLYLEQFLLYDNQNTTTENKEYILDYLIKHDELKDKINSLNYSDFNEFLTYIFANGKYEDNVLTTDIIKNRLDLSSKIIIKNESLEKYEIDKNMINSILKLPSNYLKKLNESDNEIKEEENEFVSFINNYNDPEILDILIERLETYKSKKNARIFLDFITDDFFMNSEVSRKKLLLELFPMEKVSNIDENIDVVILDYNSLSDAIEEKESLEFVNQKTNQKIIVKRKNTENN